jgi:hypothetical protein
MGCVCAFPAGGAGAVAVVGVLAGGGTGTAGAGVEDDVDDPSARPAMKGT